MDVHLPVCYVFVTKEDWLLNLATVQKMCVSS